MDKWFTCSEIQRKLEETLRLEGLLEGDDIVDEEKEPTADDFKDLADSLEDDVPETYEL